MGPKLESFCIAKETKEEKTVFKMGENICKRSTWQGIYTKIYQQLMKLNLKKEIQSKTGQKT